MKLRGGDDAECDLTEALVATWTTNARVTAWFFENLPPAVWSIAVPGGSRRTVRTIAGHIHNARCMWVKMLGQSHGIRVPKRVNLRRVTPGTLLPALERSSRGVIDLLELGIRRGGRIPAKGVAWLNMPSDVVHVLAYLTAHEAHHRGQIIMLARQAGQRLSPDITAGVWQWTQRSREAGVTRGRRAR